MATLVLNNVPEDLYQALKVAAERNHRSLNAQAIAYLSSCTGHRPR
jgi:plasmid stability protein